MENTRVVTTVSPRKQPSVSPPYRKMRAIIQKPTSKFMKSLANSSTREADLLAKPIEGNGQAIYEKPRAVPLHRNYENVIPSANVNPLTPPRMFMQTKKRTRSGQDGNDNLLNSNFPAGFPYNRINVQQQSQRQSDGFFPTQKPGAKDCGRQVCWTADVKPIPVKYARR